MALENQPSNKENPLAQKSTGPKRKYYYKQLFYTVTLNKENKCLDTMNLNKYYSLIGLLVKPKMG